MNLRRIIILLLSLFIVATVAFAQDEIATFTSDFVGNLILDYPTDWQAYDADREFITVVARGDISIQNDLNPGEAALLLLTPQSLEASGLPSTSADEALNALLGEIPDDAEISDFPSEYGFGTRYDFGFIDEMTFTVVTFDRDGIPLIAIIGMNQPDEANVEDLVEVVKTVRYTDGAFDATSVLLSQLIIDPTYGYSYEVPASWALFDDFSFNVVGTENIATVLLLTPESMETPDMPVNFETVVQAELELVADSMVEQTEVVVTNGEALNGYPTQEVVMTLTEASEDGFIPPFEYRFVLVDYGDDNVLLSAIYSEAGNSTEDYIPVLRAVAESFYYAPIYPMAESITHASLTVAYPSDYTADTSNENQLILSADDVTITVNNIAQNIETYGDIATESQADFASTIAQALTQSEAVVQPVSIGITDLARIFTQLTEDGIDTYLFVTAPNGETILLVASHSEDNFEDVRQILEAIGSQLTIAE